jgi:AcrR family transcriptional regulator
MAVAPDAVTETSETSESERPSPRARRAARTRRAILDAARELFDDQGYNHTTIEQIADRADIGRRTFFHYFPSKEALVFADFQDVEQSLWPLLEARPRTEHPLTSMVAALADHAQVMEANRDKLAWSLRISRESPSLRDYEATVLATGVTKYMVRYLAERLDTDPRTDPRPRAWALVVMSLFSTSLRMSMDHGPPGGSARQAFLALAAGTVDQLGEAVVAAQP